MSTSEKSRRVIIASVGCVLACVISGTSYGQLPNCMLGSFNSVSCSPYTYTVVSTTATVYNTETANLSCEYPGFATKGTVCGTCVVTTLSIVPMLGATRTVATSGPVQGATYPCGTQNAVASFKTVSTNVRLGVTYSSKWQFAAKNQDGSCPDPTQSPGSYGTSTSRSYALMPQ